MKKTASHRVLALMLSLCMVLSLVPLSALAVDTTEKGTATITSGSMVATVDTTFPSVIQYSLDGLTMYGQTEKLDTLLINGKEVKPVVTSTVKSDKVTYKMTVKSVGGVTTAIIAAELSVKDNILTFAITGVSYPKNDRMTNPVQSIEIPNHSLVSVRTSQKDAAFMGTRMAANTVQSGDFAVVVDKSMKSDDPAFAQDYLYAFVSGDGLSAGIASNSEAGTLGGGRDNYRIAVDSAAGDGYQSVGLRSSFWYYDRNVDTCTEPNAEKVWGVNPNALKDIPKNKRVIGPTAEEMPYAKVVITADRNGDGLVDWQDGAIAARDEDVIHKPFEGETVPELISTRIAMNFGSQAQNPFLTTLDNVKRVALNTDGLGQAILLKGYASEGHDSGHPDFADIGARMGGPEDMNTMMEEGAKYGARFGVHINASEFYPESSAFSEELMHIYDDGSMRWGWEWLDQGVGLNGLYDLAMGTRAERLKGLKTLVGDNMDFIYVDVWGNTTAGGEDAWQSRKFSQELTDNGWRVVQEWPYANEWDSTFQHWVADYTYGNYAYKGNFNSSVYRLLFNSSKDIFAPDFPHFGGYANAPLLGGSVMQGFEGWQKDGEYDLAMDTIFEHLLPTKFLQHYEIMKWVDSPSAVTMPYYPTAGKMDKGDTASWTPEAQITLQNGTDTVVVTRGTQNDPTQTFSYGTLEEKQEYRSRTITFNGKVILKGAAAPAARTAADTDVADLYSTQQYLIPWFWDADGNDLALRDQKLYHRNDVGGKSTWELPDGWAKLSSVMVYQLTDTGRANGTKVSVTNGKVTLNAKAGVPYVVVRGESAAAPKVTWSTGMHLKDVSFNSAAITDNWTVAGSGTAARFATERQIPMLKLNGEVSVSQKITDLTPGQTYAVYVGVDNRSDAKATMTVSVDGKPVASNYTLRSIAINYISAYAHHTRMPVEDGTSYFQNMYVFFTAPAAGKTVTLTLSRASGEGNTYFDDVRVVEDQAKNITMDANGNIISFRQDFENVIQGEYPFVVGNPEDVEDNRQHLSKRHEPYTQQGWEGKVLDDVISGTWSLKVNAKDMPADKLVFQTIPQNFRFEPGVTYTVTFDYEVGLDRFVLVQGDGAFDAKTAVQHPLQITAGGKAAQCSITVTGSESGQTWIGLYTTSDPVDVATNSDQGNFVLDNLVIERVAGK